MASIDAQLRLLALGKVSEDDKLVKYDALLLDRFLNIIQDVHGEDIRELDSELLTKLYVKDVMLDYKQELDEALQREAFCFRNGKGIEGNKIFRLHLSIDQYFADSQKSIVGELDIR